MSRPGLKTLFSQRFDDNLDTWNWQVQDITHLVNHKVRERSARLTLDQTQHFRYFHPKSQSPFSAFLFHHIAETIVKQLPKPQRAGGPQP
jgi:hypothetical protein